MTPIERAARALNEEICRQADGIYWCDEADREKFEVVPPAEIQATEYVGPDGTPALLRDGFDMYALTRAVLTALREPSDGMLQAGGDIAYWDDDGDGHGEYERDIGSSSAKSVFVAMIDAALSEGA
jgi:hypothetical protein